MVNDRDDPRHLAPHSSCVFLKQDRNHSFYYLTNHHQVENKKSTSPVPFLPSQIEIISVMAVEAAHESRPEEDKGLGRTFRILIFYCYCAMDGSPAGETYNVLSFVVQVPKVRCAENHRSGRKIGLSPVVQTETLVTQFHRI